MEKWGEKWGECSGYISPGMRVMSGLQVHADPIFLFISIYFNINLITFVFSYCFTPVQKGIFSFFVLNINTLGIFTGNGIIYTGINLLRITFNW
jgi:hypothetical protein